MIWYLTLLGSTLLLSRLLPGKGYVWVTAALHGLLAALRHPHLTGDLMKYHWLFSSGNPLSDWKNPGFSLLMFGFSKLSGDNYQLFLAFLALVQALVLGKILERYCGRPWLGFWVFSCLGFYTAAFSAIKQGLAMSLILLAYSGLEEGKFRKFLILTLFAGLFHLPALIFLPAYFLTRFRFDGKTAAGYLLLGAALWCFRERAAEILALWYPAELTGGEEVPGGRFFLMVLILVVGIVLRGTGDPSFSRLAHLMVCACLIQLLAGFGNVFTRLADYYFQFAILFIPGIFGDPAGAWLPLCAKSRRQLCAAAAACLLAFYFVATLNVNFAYSRDNYVNYQFFWEIREEGL